MREEVRKRGREEGNQNPVIARFSSGKEQVNQSVIARFPSEQIQAKQSSLLKEKDSFPRQTYEKSVGMTFLNVESESTTFFFYTWDHLGTTRLITDMKGAIVSRHDFEPYGVELPPNNDSSGNTHRFTGQERDASTGYDYMHFRFYASSMGRFLKPDNIIPDITNPQNWNAYSYVKGNPVNFNDPSGHMYATFFLNGLEMGAVNLGPAPTGTTGVSNSINLGTTTMLSQVSNLADVAKSEESKISFNEYLLSIGIPKDKVEEIAKQLHKIATNPNKFHERLVAIVRKGDNYEVITRLTAGDVVSKYDVIEFNKEIRKANARIIAFGHQHMPEGTWFGAKEGPSELDRISYGDNARAMPNFNPNKQFVITEKYFYYFQPNQKRNVEFLRIPWEKMGDNE